LAMGPPPKVRLSWDRFTGNLATHQKKGGVAPDLTVWSLDSMMQKLFDLWAACTPGTESWDQSASSYRLW